MRTYFIIAMLSLVCIPATAQKIAVLPVSYKQFNTDVELEEKAKDVEDNLTKSIKSAGFEPVTGKPVQDALAGKQCTDQPCLADVAGQLGAQNAIGIFIIDKEGQYDIRIVVAKGEPNQANPFCNHNAMIKRVQGIVSGILAETEKETKIAPEPQDTDPKPQTDTDTQPEEVKDTDEDPDSDSQEEIIEEPKNNKKIKPTAFWTSLAITSALGATWAITEGITYSRYKKLDEGDKDSNYWDKTKSIQTADRVIFSLAAAGVVTTAVIAIFTDFNKKDKKENKQSKFKITPMPTNQGGMMLIKGSF